MVYIFLVILTKCMFERLLYFVVPSNSTQSGTSYQWVSLCSPPEGHNFLHILHIESPSHKYSFFLPVRVYWLRCHSTSPSLFSSVPARISNNLIAMRGPTSASSTAW
jgi:hypothetical protein